MLRTGPWKLCYSHGSQAEFELYNLASDPGEFENRAGQLEHRNIQDKLFARINQLWDAERVTQEVITSQNERQLIRTIAADEGHF